MYTYFVFTQKWYWKDISWHVFPFFYSQAQQNYFYIYSHFYKKIDVFIKYCNLCTYLPSTHSNIRKWLTSDFQYFSSKVILIISCSRFYKVSTVSTFKIGNWMNPIFTKTTQLSLLPTISCNILSTLKIERILYRLNKLRWS